MSNHLIKLKRKAEALFQQNRLVEAKAAFTKIIKAAPSDFDAWLDIGVVAGMLNEFNEAEAAFRRALQINPHLPQGYYNLGKLLVLLGRMHEAEGYWRTYVSINPGLAEGHYHLAKVLMSVSRFGESLPYLREALRLAPASVEALLDYGVALQFMGCFPEAEAAFRQALAVEPGYAQAYLKLAYLYAMCLQFEQSANALREVVAMDSATKMSFSQYSGRIAIWQGEYTEAMNHYDAALAIQPNNLELRWERALQLLRLGRYQEGWREYEVRTQYRKWLDVVKSYNFPQPRWDGSPLQGRTILIYVEQGFGDAIQFSRYLPLITERGGEVIFYCYGELLRLFRRMPGVKRVELCSEKILTEEFAVHASIMSLPYLFDTRLDSIPAPIPYLTADPDMVLRWRRRIDPMQYNVGLVWSGQPIHTENFWRSLVPQDLFPLAAVGHITFYSLQKDSVAAGTGAVASKLNIEDLSAELHDFDDTAAVISNMDLVITVDTAVAHLAGALGCPTWTLLHTPSDWRWLTEREDSPWYPTMRLFRRALDEEWEAVMRRVAVALADLAAAKVKTI